VQGYIGDDYLSMAPIKYIFAWQYTFIYNTYSKLK
jgi:hypothetical protein